MTLTALDKVVDYTFEYLDFKIEFKVLKSPGASKDSIMVFYKDVDTLKSFINFINNNSCYYICNEIDGYNTGKLTLLIIPFKT